ncbi:hypothetical protein L210DRAFT_3639210 [Boletus edulis BED1]|uniref:Uncharacterized protein n=1 Tax=Boletus edulis BED1 TaxID=1328754 RepID=A0AAD4C9E3_BOLED|nr:hypothetical protein L210DRAFT_3639210 [Boletus edulis BED1]
MSTQSLNTASTTSLSPSIANLNALSSPKPSPQSLQHAQQRRLTASSLPPPTSLGLPEPVYGHPPLSSRRPHSPLRNDAIPRRNSQDSHSGDDNDDDDDDNDANRTWVRSQSPPAASVTQFAANLALRVGSFISPAQGSQALPSDAELEADAQRARDRSRREAEQILTREAEERRTVEERVLAMMNSSSPHSVPPPRSRSQTLPNPPSPASSAKEGVTGWWQTAKSRLTPTKDKEPLTPAQKVIQEARSREKEKGPVSALTKHPDPAHLNLKIPSGGPTPRASSPTSPTPDKTPIRLSPAAASQPINLSPISLQRGTSPGGSPAREQPPMYASFTPSGTLDVPGTLLTIAKRFEKLERWTVSHVRALEERMGDVERWLVDKENERTKEKDQEKQNEPEKVDHPTEPDLGAIRDDIAELQGRITELGREMARLATSPAVLSTNTAVRDSPEMRSAPPTESMIASTHESSFSSTSSTSPPGNGVSTPAMNVFSTPRRAPSLTARESTSPPLARVGPSKTSSRAGTRLPYPTGDYASPGDVVSPTHTPASSPPPASRPTSMVISLPPMSPPLEFSAPPMSPPTRMTSPTPGGLPPPNATSARRGSVSPTPLSGARKRYTVALGGPIVAPPEVEVEYERERAKALMGTAYFSAPTESSEDDDDDEHCAETVGKKAASRAAAAAKLVGVGVEDWHAGQSASTSPRARAQSTYSGSSSLQSNQAALSKHRLRSQSTDFRTDNSSSGDHQPSRFVDPLVLRRQPKSEKNKPLVGPGKKVPVGQLVAFFDSERGNH